MTHATSDAASTQRAVFDLYRSYPFPQTTAQQRREWLAYQLCKYKFLGVEEAWRGRVLDVGCGTGRTMLVPKHYGCRHYVGLDQSEVSLQYARKVSVEDGVPKFTPAKASLFQMPFADNTFDLVVCWAVLHCTPDPLGGIREMVRVCKSGGIIAFFVFNPFAHWRNHFQRWRIVRRGGTDVQARFRAAHELYGTKPVEQMSPGDIVQFVDRFCVPIESSHSYGEILGWIRQLGLTFQGTSPPLRFRDFILYLQNLADEMRAHRTDQTSTRFMRTMSRVARLSKYVPGLAAPAAPFAPPTILHRTLWQTLLAWQGRHHGSSIGASFSARKP